MADQSTQSIDIAAEPSAVMAVIADFDNYPIWAGSIKQVQITEPGSLGQRAKRVRFSIETGPMTEAYELEYTWSDDRMVEWTLTDGQVMRAQQGRYELMATPEGTHVTYWLSVDLAIPMLGSLRRKAERVVMDTALKELKKRVEVIAG
jgi:hypothetical protein